MEVDVAGKIIYFYGPWLPWLCQITRVIWLVVWNMNGWFFRMLGIIIPTDFHIFQSGWNHQPDIVSECIGENFDLWISMNWVSKMYGTFEHGVLLLSNKRWGTIKFKIEPAEWGVLPINIKTMGPRGIEFWIICKYRRPFVWIFCLKIGLSDFVWFCDIWYIWSFSKNVPCVIQIYNPQTSTCGVIRPTQMKIGFPPNNQLGAALLWYINPGLVQRLLIIESRSNSQKKNTLSNNKSPEIKFNL